MLTSRFWHLTAVIPILFASAPVYSAEIWKDQLGTRLSIEDLDRDPTRVPDNVFVGSGALGESGLSPNTAHARLTAVASAPGPRLRGAKEARLYAELSPRVVMVVTNDSIGSGALIGDAATVLTNWHVVEGYSTVGVIYKPIDEGQTVTSADIRLAQVVRVDEVADLALLKVGSPASVSGTIELGSVTEVPVGSDVHAIGHPTGESWTYTRGFVSQMRKQYEWVTEAGKMHRADVIQTQTPINPGNSGGPLISDDFRLVGVNSFKSEGEGLNFAVSVDEVRHFLARSENRYAGSTGGSGSKIPSEECEPMSLGTERSSDDTGLKHFIDLNCDGNAEGFRLVPDNSDEPILFCMDSRGDGLIDTIYVDVDRDGQVDSSFYDIDGDGEPDLVGRHRNGDIEPYVYDELPS